MIFHDRQVNSRTFQACKMKFLNSMIFPVFHNLYKPCHKTFCILHEFGKYKRILLLSFLSYTISKSIFNNFRFYGGTARNVFCIPNVRLCISFLTMCSVRSRENNDCFVYANSFVCILNCLSVKLFFSVISWQWNIAVKIT